MALLTAPRYRQVTPQTQPVQTYGSPLPGQTRVPIDDGGDPTPPKTGRPPTGALPPSPGGFPTKPTGSKPAGTGVPPQPPQPPVPPPVPPKPKIPVPPPPAPIEPPDTEGSLRGEIYLPGDDARLKGAQGATDLAAKGIQGFDRSGVQTGNEDRYRSLYGTGAVTLDTDLLGAPDRTALAKQKLKDFDAVSEEQRFNEERALGRNISKFGRGGLQANADNFGDITRRIAGDRGRLANELASSVSEGDINDRYRTLDLKKSVAEGNADRAFTRSQAAVNSATGQTDRASDDLNNKFDAANSLEDRIFGQGQSNRGEYRTERGRQDQQAQQTIENRLRQLQIQQELEDQRLRRAAAYGQAGGNL